MRQGRKSSSPSLYNNASHTIVQVNSGYDTQTVSEIHMELKGKMISSKMVDAQAKGMNWPGLSHPQF